MSESDARSAGPAADTASAPPAAGAERRAWTGWLGRFFGSTILIALGFACAAWWFVYDFRLPRVSRIVEGGSIFVHGPQVYTRERLVNDRYQEDSWLNSMLDQSIRERFGYAGVSGTSTVGRREGTVAVGGDESATGAGAGGTQPAAPATPAAPAATEGLPDISEQPTFKLQATRAYREQIRTMLIENQLDDRHDLHGNTLYRLRFDATILPNDGSQSAAQIEILIDPPANNAVPDNIAKGTATFAEFEGWLDGWRDLYVRWRASLELRLEDQALARARSYDSGRFGPDDYDALLARLHGSVLQIAREIEDVPKRMEEARRQIVEAYKAAEKALIAGGGKRSPPNKDENAPDRLSVCITDTYKHAGQELAEMRKAASFPVAGKPDPIELKVDELKQFRDGFLSGALESDDPLEQHAAHEIYRTRIRELLVLRRSLVQLVDTSPCDRNLRYVALVQTSPQPPPSQVPSSAAPPPSPVPSPQPAAPGATAPPSPPPPSPPQPPPSEVQASAAPPPSPVPSPQPAAPGATAPPSPPPLTSSPTPPAAAPDAPPPPPALLPAAPADATTAAAAAPVTSGVPAAPVMAASPGPPGSLQAVQAPLPPVQIAPTLSEPPKQLGTLPTASAAGPSMQPIDAARLRRRLLDSEFWPRIYKAVTGVDDSMETIDDPMPRPDFKLQVTPPSLARFALVEWEPRLPRRAFQVKELSDTLTVAKRRECLTGVANAPIDAVAFQGQTLFVQQGRLAQLLAIAPGLQLKLLLERAVTALAERERAATGLRASGVPINACDFAVVPIEVPVGLFNFATRLSQAKEVYTYAISPTEPDDLVANRIRTDLMREFGVQATLKSLSQGTQPLSARLKAQEEMAKFLRYDTVQRSVFGYGEKSGQARIGWQVLPRDQLAGDATGRSLAPRQMPMTALISLPAWWEKIRLTVKRAWIDHNGRALAIDAAKEPPSYLIDLPTNFETLDASLFANADSGPVLIDWQIPRLAVRPCQPFSVTLIGRRLWRSTVVTLAGERANRVLVMPNMNGIIATFDRAPRPGNLPDRKLDGKAQTFYAQLTIWTSQGHVHLPRLIKFELPATSAAVAATAEQSCPKAAESMPAAAAAPASIPAATPVK